MKKGVKLWGILGGIIMVTGLSFLACMIFLKPKASEEAEPEVVVVEPERLNQSRRLFRRT